ncbi:LacI family DNA-binding transcriptional regulator [Saccharopolyspora hordei]|uniref:LacI family transcriptional regulator n=1 Tax=Saccharopolyspora hordei TaxID=1838 RepID=A0A853AKH5_9PSEU|nr:LacI family DNA-binding transcriptional regulator [Saccharopolyspora hordei]NYI85202.1 LacI family transcriptional regulator [Saccharopolyspora hordei]
MARSRRVTLQDVADEVGLSVNTVSRALAGKNQVSERTRSTVRSVAARLGYVPNSHARSLVSGRTMVVGLVITNPSNPFYAALISAVEQRCRRSGYSVLLLVTEESEANEGEAVEQLLTYGVDGVIAIPVQRDGDSWSRLAAAKIPVVFVSRDLPEFGFDFVGIDAEAGVAEAVERVAAGIDRAWLFEEDLRISTTEARIAGFRRALEAGGIDQRKSLVLKVQTRRTAGASRPWRPDDAYQMAANLITEQNHPDLVVAGNDHFALGILKALRERGLAVPDDVQVVGYGDHPFAAYLDPALTTLRLPAEDVGATAVDHLLERIADPAGPRRTLLFRPELVERDSTRRPVSA